MASYRRTICRVEPEEYAVRRINGIVEPLVVKSNHARQAMIQVLTEAITALDWADFETLVFRMKAPKGGPHLNLGRHALGNVAFARVNVQPVAADPGR